MSDPVRFYVFRIELDGIDPSIWRRVEVDGAMNLKHLAWVLMEAMGWEGFHGWMFEAGGRRYAQPEEDVKGEVVSAERVPLSEVLPMVGAEVQWIYDFGDDWRHSLRLEAIRETEPSEQPRGLLEGEGACPGEDCGGAPLYQERVQAYQNGEGGDDYHEDSFWWGFDPEDWDPEDRRREVEDQLFRWRYRGELEDLEFLFEWKGAFPVDTLRQVEADGERFGAVIHYLAERALQNWQLAEEFDMPVGVEMDEFLDVTFFYLLALWRRAEGFPLILQLCRLSDQTLNRIWADAYLSDFPRLLAMTCHGRMEGLGEILCDPGLESPLRSCAVDALLMLYRMNEIDKAETTRWLLRWIREDLPRRPGWEWDSLLLRAIEVSPKLCREDVLKAFDEGLSVEGLVSRKGLLEEMKTHPEGRTPEDLPDLWDPFTSTVEVLEDWPVWEEGPFDLFSPTDGFLDDGQSNQAELQEVLEGIAAMGFDLPNPAANRKKKIGRNDPCPCGSGKKYKKCCGR